MSPMPLLPAKDDRIGWKAIWYAQGQNWRTEPLIDKEREKYLTERRSIEPDWEQGIYPFKDIKLSRADVEWLLATYYDGRVGPVDWSDKSQRGREGLDLRGANLRDVNLSFLPLAGLIAGWPVFKQKASADQIEAAAVHLEGADLTAVHLEGTTLAFAHLENADLSYAHLEDAWLPSSHLEGADFHNTHLEGTILIYAHLEGADLSAAHLEGTTLRNAHLERANLSEAFLTAQRNLMGSSSPITVLTQLPL